MPKWTPRSQINPKKKVRSGSVLLTAILSFSGVFLLTAALPLQEICFKDNCVTAESARSPEQRTKGLMYRPSLAGDRGMLLMFEKPGHYSIWMKNMKFPIDIIWINEAAKVVHITPRVQPCKNDPCPSYSADEAAIYVLEVPAGTAESLGIIPGAEAKIGSRYLLPMDER